MANKHSAIEAAELVAAIRAVLNKHAGLPSKEWKDYLQSEKDELIGEVALGGPFSDLELHAIAEVFNPASEIEDSELPELTTDIGPMVETGSKELQSPPKAPENNPPKGTPIK